MAIASFEMLIPRDEWFAIMTDAPFTCELVDEDPRFGFAARFDDNWRIGKSLIPGTYRLHGETDAVRWNDAE